jgi:hypothetical protein
MERDSELVNKRQKGTDERKRATNRRGKRTRNVGVCVLVCLFVCLFVLVFVTRGTCFVLFLFEVCFSPIDNPPRATLFVFWGSFSPQLTNRHTSSPVCC